MDAQDFSPMPSGVSVSSPLVLQSARQTVAKSGNTETTTKWCWVLFGVAVLLGVVMVGVLLATNKSNKAAPSTRVADPSDGVVKLKVLNSIRAGVKPDTFEHVIYFTLQDDAELFRFLINDRLVGQGNFEDLDIRFAPPYRRVIFVTKVRPVLPLHVVVESYDKDGMLIGEGDLAMTQFSYHDKS